MNKDSMGQRLFVAGLVKKVRAIRAEKIDRSEKLLKLEAIARGLDWEHAASESKLRHAESQGRRLQVRALRRYLDTLSRAMKFVTAVAHKLRSTNKGSVGFGYEPAHFAYPGWEKPSKAPERP